MMGLMKNKGKAKKIKRGEPITRSTSLTRLETAAPDGGQASHTETSPTKEASTTTPRGDGATHGDRPARAAGTRGSTTVRPLSMSGKGISEFLADTSGMKSSFTGETSAPGIGAAVPALKRGYRLSLDDGDAAQLYFKDNLRWLMNMSELKAGMSTKERRDLVLSRGGELLRAGYKTEKVRFELTDDSPGSASDLLLAVGGKIDSKPEGIQRSRSVSIISDRPPAFIQQEATAARAAEEAQSSAEDVSSSSASSLPVEQQEEIPFEEEADEYEDTPLEFESDEGSDAELMAVAAAEEEAASLVEASSLDVEASGYGMPDLGSDTEFQETPLEEFSEDDKSPFASPRPGGSNATAAEEHFSRSPTRAQPAASIPDPPPRNYQRGLSPRQRQRPPPTAGASFLALDKQPKRPMAPIKMESQVGRGRSRSPALSPRPTLRNSTTDQPPLQPSESVAQMKGTLSKVPKRRPAPCRRMNLGASLDEMAQEQLQVESVGTQPPPMPSQPSSYDCFDPDSEDRTKRFLESLRESEAESSAKVVAFAESGKVEVVGEAFQGVRKADDAPKVDLQKINSRGNKSLLKLSRRKKGAKHKLIRMDKVGDLAQVKEGAEKKSKKDKHKKKKHKKEEKSVRTPRGGPEAEDTGPVVQKEASVAYESPDVVREFPELLPDEIDSDEEDFGSDIGISDTGEWVQRFQQALTVIRSCNMHTMADELTKAYADMSSLAQDFLHCAQTYGKIIISERFLPDHQRTIQPKKLGGVAGGEKYIVNNVLFKFAVDTHGLLGSDYAAAKIAGNELKGLICYFNCSLIELHLPLMALVDYKGFRLVAMSLLPIGANTLKYGTHDAGVTLVNSDPTLDTLMKMAAKRINVKSHLCGLEKGEPGVVLHSAADVEGHRGTDGQYYLLDFARTIPPETPDPRIQGSHLYRLMRPEFVKSYEIPLCPDAFSGFILSDPGARRYNQEIEEATNYLKEKVIPKHIRSLTWQIMEAREKGTLDNFHLPEAIHAKGICMRHIGLLLSHLRDPEQFHEVRVLLVIEAIARVVKNRLRAKLRKKMQRLKQPLEAPYRRLVINFMNLVFGRTRRSDTFWNTTIKSELRQNFSVIDPITEYIFRLKSILTKWESPHITPYAFLFNRIAKLTGLRFSAIAKRKMVQPRLDVVSRVAYPFDDTDLDGIGERVKHLNIVAEALGSYYHHKGLECRMLDDNEGARDLLNVAIQKFEEALASNPTSQDLLRNTALCLTRLIELDMKSDAKFSMSDSLVQKAEQYYIRAINEGEDALSLYSYAKFLWKCSRTERTEEYFLQSLEAQPNFIWSLRDYSRFMLHQGEKDAAEAFMKQYKAISANGEGSARGTQKVPINRPR